MNPPLDQLHTMKRRMSTSTKTYHALLSQGQPPATNLQQQHLTTETFLWFYFHLWFPKRTGNYLRDTLTKIIQHLFMIKNCQLVRCRGNAPSHRKACIKRAHSERRTQWEKAQSFSSKNRRRSPILRAVGKWFNLRLFSYL